MEFWALADGATVEAVLNCGPNWRGELTRLCTAAREAPALTHGAEKPVGFGARGHGYNAHDGLTPFACACGHGWPARRLPAVSPMEFWALAEARKATARIGVGN